MDRFLEGCRVLVVEDEYLAALDVQQMLEDLGAIVVGPVGRLDQALELARGEALTGAILDVKLNGDTTLALARELIRKGVAVVFLTGYGAGAIDAEFRDVPRMTKPCDSRQAARMLRSAFG